ncbi:MAG: ABC transporter ATP-binding protein [Candidatus Sumerlaeaceae bacterium]
MKSRRPRNDFITYWRLISYLRGYWGIVAVLFGCIILEALFTVATISTLKPILHLIENKPLVEIADQDAGIGLEIGTPVAGADGTIATRAAGELQGHDAVKKFNGAIRSQLGHSGGQVLVDLSGVHGISSEALGSWLQLKLDAGISGADLTLLLPDGFSRPAEPSDSDHFHLAAGDAASQLRARYFNGVTGLVIPGSHNVSGDAVSLKKRFVNAVTPHLQQLQNYSAQSTRNKIRVLALFVGILVGSGILTALTGYGVGYLSKYLAFGVVQRMRDHVFQHIMGLDLSYFAAQPPGVLMSHVTQDVKAVEGAVDLLFSNVFKTPVTVITLVSFMLMISPSLTFFTFVIVPALAGMLFVIGKRIRRVSGRVQKSMGILSSIMEEAISGVRVVKAFNMEKREGERFHSENRRIFKMGMRTNAAEELGSSVTQMIGMCMVAAILLLGGRYILSGELSSSNFVLFVGFLMRLFQPMKGMSKVTSRLQRGLAGCDRVFHVLDQHPVIVDSPGAVFAPVLKDGIEFRDATFQYTPERGPVLRDISLKLRAGRAIALVGETGSGKSTFVNLLPRFYDPTEGAILFDGIDLRQLQVKSLRDQIAIVTQDPVLFNDTIANNVAYGHRRAGKPDRAAVEAATKAAKLHDFIVDLPNGYDTMIGSRGSLLSGGQKQRLAIARAIYRDAPILILDEATSSLDSETESLIQEALNNLMEHRTTVVVAHRLSTIQRCDEIYVMDKGRFIEHGTHDELLVKNGRYARFHQIQFAGAGT